MAHIIKFPSSHVDEAEAIKRELRAMVDAARATYPRLQQDAEVRRQVRNAQSDLDFFHAFGVLKSHRQFSRGA